MEIMKSDCIKCSVCDGYLILRPGDSFVMSAEFQADNKRAFLPRVVSWTHKSCLQQRNGGG